MDLFKKSFKLYGLMIAASFMCFILVMSFNVMGSVFLTEEIGYTVYGTNEEGKEPVEMYKHYYTDGEDKQYEKYEFTQSVNGYKNYSYTNFSCVVSQ